MKSHADIICKGIGGSVVVVDSVVVEVVVDSVVEAVTVVSEVDGALVLLKYVNKTLLYLFA